ncbi:uncharacterized protein LOC100558236 [Anolis carolinensis]|uniref:uncharacterized protein LOC100558236 n=1 Tax=Anolis carolinensis TaxID=28377 RepID=UPI000203AE4E|nr:PREDICTED: carcinoembryonic antigen-related cell adhesion molecule 1 [Anolis carolinensis]|eukprot:XP_003228776.1 PREDICTED: carcinoembryonic antigen-related cell adhesion molecule 1 [Anolis carolinensis]
MPTVPVLSVSGDNQDGRRLGIWMETERTPNILPPSGSKGPCRYYLGRRRSPWPGLLLTGYILSSCLSLASALNYTILVTVDPWFPLVGMGATLVAKGGMENFISCSWYRWEISDPSLILVYDTSTKKVQHKPAYTGRETLRKNCSLYIEKLSIEDITYFFILKNSTTSSEAGQVFLVIKEGLPHKKQPKGLSGGAIAGIFVICVVFASAVAIVTSYKIIASSMGRNNELS